MFSPATVGFGAQRRNQFYGPRYFDTDLTVMKNFKVPHWEQARFGIGAQFFNLFNHPNFDQPSGDIANPNFGTIISTVNTPTSILGSFLGGDASPRLIQFKGVGGRMLRQKQGRVGKKSPCKPQAAAAETWPVALGRWLGNARCERCHLAYNQHRWQWPRTDRLTWILHLRIQAGLAAQACKLLLSGRASTKAAKGNREVSESGHHAVGTSLLNVREAFRVMIYVA
jgi:hypothetical protein